MNSLPVFVTVISFGVFTFLGGDLTPARAFTSLSLFAVLRSPLNMLPNLLSQVLDHFYCTCIFPFSFAKIFLTRPYLKKKFRGYELMCKKFVVHISYNIIFYSERKKAYSLSNSTLIVQVVNAHVSLQRMEELFLTEERILAPNPPLEPGLPAISIKNGCFSWDSKVFYWHSVYPHIHDILYDICFFFNTRVYNFIYMQFELDMLVNR